MTDAQPTSGASVVGRVDGSSLAGAISQVTWARDSSHLCSFRQPSGADFVEQSTTFEPGALFLDDPATGASRRVVRFGTYGPMSGPTVLSCSVPDTAPSWARASWSSSTRCSHDPEQRRQHGVLPAASSFRPRPQGSMASADGTLDRGRIHQRDVGPAANSGNQFTVYDSSTGAALATVPNDIVTFSDDDSRVLTVQDVQQHQPGRHLPAGRLAHRSGALERPPRPGQRPDPARFRRRRGGAHHPLGSASARRAHSSRMRPRSSSELTGRPCSCPRSVPWRVDRLAGWVIPVSVVTSPVPLK